MIYFAVIEGSEGVRPEEDAYIAEVTGGRVTDSLQHGHGLEPDHRADEALSTDGHMTKGSVTAMGFDIRAQAKASTTQMKRFQEGLRTYHT